MHAQLHAGTRLAMDFHIDFISNTLHRKKAQHYRRRLLHNYHITHCYGIVYSYTSDMTLGNISVRKDITGIVALNYQNGEEKGMYCVCIFHKRGRI